MSDAFWLAGTKLGNNPYFYWMGVNKPMNTFTDWATNPNGDTYGNKYCMEIIADGNNNKLWHAAHCDNLNFFICEE